MLIAASSFRLIARIALFAMLCQSLLPTAAYTSAAHDQAMLAEMARSFGVAGSMVQSAHAHHHHQSAAHDAPSHDHGVHCSLCLAHVLDLTLAVIAIPHMPSLPFDRPRATIFHAAYLPQPLRVIMPRGPPGLDARVFIR